MSATVSPFHTSSIRPVSVTRADHREIELPFVEDRLGLGLAAGLQDHQHPLLALRQHHLIGRHPLFAAGHLVHVEPDADAALGRHLDRGGGEAGRAHVLDRDDRVGRHQLEAGLDQQFLGERVADLDGRALLLAVLGKIGAGHGRAVDAVAAGLGADIDDRIADAGGGRIEDLVGFGDADGHRVDQDVAVISRVEIDLAADGRARRRNCRSRRCPRRRPRPGGASWDGRAGRSAAH